MFVSNRSRQCSGHSAGQGFVFNRGRQCFGVTPRDKGVLNACRWHWYARYDRTIAW